MHIHTCIGIYIYIYVRMHLYPRIVGNKVLAFCAAGQVVAVVDPSRAGGWVLAVEICVLSRWSESIAYNVLLKSLVFFYNGVGAYFGFHVGQDLPHAYCRHILFWIFNVSAGQFGLLR